MRWFDTETSTDRCSDVVLFESEDPFAYYRMIEDLRDTELFTRPYLKVEEMVFGIEEGFRRVSPTERNSEPDEPTSDNER